MSKPLHNYLRMFRRGAGLTQKEVAYLLGIPSASQVSRLERGAREPNLRILFAYEFVFRTSGSRLFTGIREEVERRSLGRARRLLVRLNKATDNALLDRKRETLQAILESDGNLLDLPV